MWGYLLYICTVLCLLVQKLTADCQHMDQFYMNHTLWLPDSCTICSCLDPVSVCESVRCLNPNCFYSKGEYLQIPHDGCCPECVGTLAPCQYDSKTVPHNTDWYPEPCSHCTCWNGEVTCSAVACPRQTCKPGTVSQSLPGQCCPQCTASGRSCEVDGVIHDDGEEWSPLPCTKCVCQDGAFPCYPIQCPPLICPPGQEMERSPHTCCPICQSQMCTDNHKKYQNNESWQKDDCTFCTCLQGETVCRRRDCVDPKELECGKNEKKAKRPGDCCIECVSRQASCDSEVPLRYHGDVWNISACEFCLCENGQVQCHKATCEPLFCELYETRVHLDGKCCPECMEQPRCYSDGDIYLDGDTWYPDPCSICNCREGHITCYQKPCPVCPQGQVSVLHQGECCGNCKPLQCGTACSVCRPDNPDHCLVCKQPGLLLQKGSCVTSCQDNFYVTRDAKCAECHDTCASCTEGSQHHCTQCKPGLLWRDGQCVARCGSSFYQDGGQCRACHGSCSECLGPNEDSCLSCTIPGQLLMSGRCVNDCGPQYYVSDQKCIACQPSCLSCSSDGRFCTNCTQSLVLHKGQCVTSCPRGYFISIEGVCTACHPSCKKCTGPLEADCLSCLDGSALTDRGRCELGTCSDGHYKDANGNCQKCEAGCLRCHAAEDGEHTVCLECPRPMVVFDNICVRQCPIGHFNQSSICRKCSSGCVECASPAQCTRCGPSLLLSEGVCVLQCSPTQTIDPLYSVCQDCPVNCLSCSTSADCAHCDDTTFLKMGTCVSDCGQGFYQDPHSRQCTANHHRPTLQVLGQIQVQQGGRTRIPGNLVSLSDSDTSKDDLQLVVTQPSDIGTLVKAIQGNDGILKSGDTFSLVDLESGKIHFLHKNGAGRKGKIVLRVSDGQLYSKEKALHIVVIPKHSPYLRRHESLLAFLDNETTIGPQQVEIGVDSLEETVTITLLQGPSHGQIVNKVHNVTVSEITLKDWTNEKLAYKIGNSKATSDQALFQIFDGYHTLNFLLDITIRKQEDILPMILQNNMGHVIKGQLLQLTSELLSAKVMDTTNAPSDDIIFTLSPPVNNPKEGQLTMIVHQPEDGPGRGWMDVGGGKMSAKMFRFLQRDIDEGRIWYQHMGASADDDFFTFEVSDTANQPNILRDQVFHIQVMEEEVTTAVPTIAPGSKLGISVLENHVTPISSTNLAFQDRDTEDRDIVYTIVKPLAPGEGTIEYVSHPFTPITSFSQEDINNNRIMYRPPPKELGAQEREFSFTFTVSDGNTNYTKEERFIIRVIPVNNEPPQFAYRNAPVQVTRGGSAPLGLPVLGVMDPDTSLEDLKFTLTVMPNHGQMEKILNSSKVYMRQGDEFTYHEIQTNSFQYTQDKSDHARSDQLEVTVSDGVHQVTSQIQVSIISVDNSAPVLLSTATCRVLVKEGDTVVLRRTELGFMDEEDSDERLRIILNSYIAHGSFKYKAARLLQKGSSFTQQDVNDGLISYSADKEIGIQPITEVLVLNVTDSKQNLLPNQVLSIVVEPVDNQPPSVVVGEDIRVEEGGTVSVSLNNIKATDMDSSVAHLTVHIKVRPSFGRIVSTRTEAVSELAQGPSIVTSFTLEDIVEGYIYYEQSDHSNKEPVADGFLFTVTDGNNTTPYYRLNITISLVNDEKPTLITEQLFVREDNSVPLTNASLYIVDLDTPPRDLILTVTSAPSQGVLGFKTNSRHPSPIIKELIKGHRFTYQNVLDELIVYRHSVGNVKGDYISLSVSDGDFQAKGTLTIVIGIVNDETPRMSVNRGLRVNSGSSTFIKSKDLQSTDIDSEDSMLLYTITQDSPAGHLQYVKGGNSELISSKGPIRTFLQSDINSGYIQYVHQSGEMTGVVLFKFDVEDSEGNRLIDQDFFITVIEDRHPPQVVASRELVVREGSSARLTSEFLSYTDVDSEPASLQYFLISAPHLGHLELTGNPGVPVSEFSQSDLAANSVMYYHTSPTEEYMDAFTYTVTDGTNEVTHKFTITITPVDDEIPLVINNGLTVQEGVRKLITEFELKALDKDTEERHLLFTIVNPPVHGSLQTRTDRGYQTITSFTMADIYNNRVSYLHDGSETQTDSFAFTVTDGTTKMFSMQRDGRRGDISVPSPNPQSFDIKVLPMDDGTPVLHTNLGFQFLEHSNGQIANFITNKELLATDIDTPADGLVYHVMRQPRFGQLEKTESPGQPISVFSQDDVNNQLIRYVLTGDISVAKDEFVFDLMDSKPNRVTDNTFYISWSYIEFNQVLINVTETSGIVQVPVNRKGNLKQYCVVSCRTVPLTATSQSVSSRPGTQDFVEKTGQIQFEEWQDSKMCNIIINDDSLYEGTETFSVEIFQPIYTLLGRKNRATVSILDSEDEPLLQFNQSVYHVSENDGYFHAAISRSGDVSDSVSAVCYTVPLTARGSSVDRLESGSDYITRQRSNRNRVVFPAGVTSATCSIKVIDDSLFESPEEFELRLSDSSYNAKIGTLSSATVILDGPNDESSIHWALPHYHFDEDAGAVELEIIRVGSDLSHTSVVWCATRLSEPPSANPGEDYIPSSTQVTFSPGQASQKCHLTLLDDSVEPRLEGNETFTVWLSTPVGSSLGNPHTATVTIYDGHLDIPTMEFTYTEMVVKESERVVEVPIRRLGDCTQNSSVICYTRQNTAVVMIDYTERPLTEASRVVFLPGEKVKTCSVGIVDDSENEPVEFFYVWLTQPKSSGKSRAAVGAQVKVKITIINPEDAPKVQFEQVEYTVHEPTSGEHPAILNVRVLREGDVDHTSTVRCSTRDGSAVAGRDYNAKSQILTFSPGQRFVEFPVEILHNDDIEWHESFRVLLGPEDPSGASLGDRALVTVTILDDEVSGSLVFPAPPMVVSLLHLDNLHTDYREEPSPGYPLVCVSPCDIQYPSYSSTHSLCEQSGIDQSAVSYRWEVAMPTDVHGARPPFVMVTDNTPFTSVDSKVLDSIYFRPSFRVRCIIQPLHSNGNPGIPSKSHEVSISHDNGICNSPVFKGTPNSYSAQSFLANLRYVGPGDKKHPNTVHISIKVPHQDGHLPLISTYPIHNLRYLLSEPVYRQQHLCSNLITPSERSGIVNSGFLDSEELDPATYNFPYQYDPHLRENKTLDLYHHLNMKSCMWRFDAWYHMSDLVDVCGGKIMADFQVKDAGKTYLTVVVPLYVYYVYATAPIGWGSLQHHTQMEFSFYYDTILWHSGLETKGTISGDLQVLKILVGRDGKLIVDFKTHARFRGLYVLQHHTLPNAHSRIIPPTGMTISLDLTLVWGQQTFDSPQQFWRATSDFSIKDYTGTYVLELIPCTVHSTQKFTSNQSPIPCTANPPQRFEVPIAFQQSNHPVPLVYSLDTSFQLTSNEKFFLMDIHDEQLKEEMIYDGVFEQGQTVYGRVSWNPEQDLQSAYKLSIQKVYLCAGKNGYIPNYDPEGDIFGEGKQFGCVQPSPELQFRFLILDRGNTDVTHRELQGIPFRAEFASDRHPSLETFSGVDGFSFSVDPLYKVSSGNQWYLQVIYLITTSKSDGSFHRMRRSTSLLSKKKRDTSSVEDILESIEKSGKKNGTNISPLPLVSSKADQSEDTLTLDSSSHTVPIMAPVLTVLFIIVVIICIVIFLVYRRKKRKRPDNSSQANNQCALESVAQNPACQRQMSRTSLSLSRINVNVKEIKDSTVSQSESERTASVQLMTSDTNTQGRRKRHAGTEV